MSVIIGSARIDERGCAHGGKPGDQTKEEVSTQAYYTHSKGWNVLRAKDPAKREKIAANMQAACDNNNWGYDQYQRFSGMNKVANYNYDASKLSVPAETDCSNLVRVCCLYAGIKVDNFTTYNELSTLLATKEFDQVHVSLPSGLRRGDILVTKTKGHTVVVISNSAIKDTTVKPVTPKYKVGWNQDQYGWWFANTETTYYAGSWQIINGKAYWFKNSGYAATGWVKINHHWYYFDPVNCYMREGWRKINNKWYYLQDTDDDNIRGACWHETKDQDGSLEPWYVD